MGGNALNTTRRHGREEYFQHYHEISRILSENNIEFSITRCLPNKMTFGDLDLVYHSSDTSDMINLLGSTEIVRNGPVTSCNYRELQVDMIRSTPEEFNFACNYYCNVGDRGNFVGKLAHSIGLKFGHDGLWMVVRATDSHLLGEVLLTQDPLVAEEFLDVKPLVNPQTLEDVFENVAASKYFNPAGFLLENNNAIARVRDRKRPAYNAILEWSAKLPEPKGGWFPRVKDKSVFLQMIFEKFPDAKVEYDELWRKKVELDKFREMFNGDLVTEWTGKTGKELGEFMVILKQHLRPAHVVNNMTKEQVETFVRTYWQSH